MTNVYSRLAKLFVIYFISSFLASNFCIAQPLVTFTSRINTGLNSPIDLVNAKDGSNRLFVAEQGGIIKVFAADHSAIGTFLTVTGISTGGEQGLLSIAFHPDYANADPAIGGFLYVYYTNAASDLEIARYHVSTNANIADATSKTIILTIPHPSNTNHNGGKLNFGADGFLYLATGDGGSGGDPPNNAQRGDVLLGKMLRINVTNSPSLPYYTIPLDNPYVGAGDPLDEIFAFGLRNPFRWSFDRVTNAMWIGDVGQGLREEVNYRAAGTTSGVNYGWRCYEGNNPFNLTGCNPIGSYVFPIYDYVNTSPASVCGGVVYRGSLYPALQGYYIFSDIYSANVYLTNTNTFTTTIQSGLPGSIVCYGETETGEVYAVSLNGIVYSVETSSVLPTKLSEFSGSHIRDGDQLNWKTSFEENLRQFEIEYSSDGVRFNRAGVVTANNLSNGSSYQFIHNYATQGEVYYRLKMVDIDEQFAYSSIIKLSQNINARNLIAPSIINNGILTLFAQDSWAKLELINAAGTVVLTKNLSQQTGRIDIVVSKLTPGVYFAVLMNGGKLITQKVVITN